VCALQKKILQNPTHTTDLSRCRYIYSSLSLTLFSSFVVVLDIVVVVVIVALFHLCRISLSPHSLSKTTHSSSIWTTERETFTINNAPQRSKVDWNRE
jgi:hypothetical protein